MISSLGSALSRRTLAGSLALGAALTACAAQAASLTMYRDANCGCCLAWAEHVERGGVHDVEAVSHPDMAA
ncbi:MAG TPA: metal-binding protein, partial [Erythrobacter sp.]|nr:metal-binding protein [Erythrobacter sp.]